MAKMSKKQERQVIDLMRLASSTSWAQCHAGNLQQRSHYEDCAHVASYWRGIAQRLNDAQERQMNEFLTA